MTDNLMDEWVTTKEASTVKNVGLSQHRIAELARNKQIVAKRVGKKKWKVKVTYKDKRWDLVGVNEIKQNQQGETVEAKDKISEVIQELKKVNNSIDILRKYKLNLASGVSEYDIPVPIRPIFQELALRGIVKVQQRRRSSGTHPYDESYWELTDRGKDVIRYLDVV